MKYIRTKDGSIIDVSNKEIDINCRSDIVFEDNTYIAEENILKIADTIEELCDEFVYATNKRNIINKIVLFGPEEKLLQTYGAIWTDKGLKYVAKMDDKGELELL